MNTQQTQQKAHHFTDYELGAQAYIFGYELDSDASEETKRGYEEQKEKEA